MPLLPCTASKAAGRRRVSFLGDRKADRRVVRKEEEVSLLLPVFSREDFPELTASKNALRLIRFDMSVSSLRIEVLSLAMFEGDAKVRLERGAYAIRQ